MTSYLCLQQKSTKCPATSELKPLEWVSYKREDLFHLTVLFKVAGKLVVLMKST
jgi:hypothetical protein